MAAQLPQPQAGDRFIIPAAARWSPIPNGRADHEGRTGVHDHE